MDSVQKHYLHKKIDSIYGDQIAYTIYSSATLPAHKLQAFVLKENRNKKIDALISELREIKKHV